MISTVMATVQRVNEISLRGKFFRLAYLVITLTLFLSLIVLGIVALLRPELAAEYGVRVVIAIVAGALLLLGLDIAAKRLDRNNTRNRRGQ